MRLLRGDFKENKKEDLLELAKLIRVPTWLTRKEEYEHAEKEIVEYFKHIGKQMTAADEELLRKLKIKPQ